MKNISLSLIAVVLAIAVFGLCCRLYISDGSDTAAQESSANPSVTEAVYETILTRASVRSYSDREVESATLDSLLHAAMAAPTAMDIRPWHFIVVNEREILDTIGTMAGAWAPVGRSQAAVVVCGSTVGRKPGTDNGFWMQDCSAATENLLLAAHAMGLGAVWCGAYPHADRVVSLRTYFGLPDTIVPLNVVALGYPASEVVPKRKFNEERIHANGW